jgi:hypothetical protein
MGFLAIGWNKRLVAVAAFAIALLLAFGRLGGFASIISGGFEAGLGLVGSLGDGYRSSAWGPTAHWIISSAVISRWWVIAGLPAFSRARGNRGARRSGGYIAWCRGHGRIHDSFDNWATIGVGLSPVWSSCVLKQGEFSGAHQPMGSGQIIQDSGSQECSQHAVIPAFRSILLALLITNRHRAWLTAHPGNSCAL